MRELFGWVAYIVVLEKTKKTLLWVRIAGVVLVLIGIFTRAYTY